jgi:hypothetical protein
LIVKQELRSQAVMGKLKFSQRIIPVSARTSGIATDRAISGLAAFELLQKLLPWVWSGESRR